MTVYTEEYLRTQVGRKVRCIIHVSPVRILIITDGVLGRYYGDTLCICQNLVDGVSAINKFGYKYAWAFTCLRHHYTTGVTDLELL